MKVLSVNSWPMASKCPIGYMGEHLFNDPRFDVLELASRDEPVYDDFALSYAVNFNAGVIELSAKKASSGALGDSILPVSENRLGPLVKSIAKTLAPIRLGAGAKATISKFGPEVVYTQGYDIRILKTARHIARACGVPLVVHTLDYWLSDHPLIRLLQRREFASCTDLGKRHLAGSPAMVDWLQQDFGVESDFVSNCAEYKISCPTVSLEGKALRYLYAGNLTPMRHLTLNMLADEMKDHGSLEVYAPEGQIAQYGGCMDESIRVSRSVDQEKVSSLMEEADVLVHVESFESKAVGFTRYSLSTKIAECLAMGKPLLYVGPKETGVADFLERFKCGLRAYESSEIESCLDMLGDPSVRESLAVRQMEVGRSVFERGAARGRLEKCLKEA